jgi:hypothetical protein
MIRQKESAAYAALIPGATDGLYTFHFVTRVRVCIPPAPMGLTVGWLTA